jgi:D-arabinose 1-dehydrogenase-like Zn-dependent alcohol dehydrogenase
VLAYSLNHNILRLPKSFLSHLLLLSAYPDLHYHFPQHGRHNARSRFVKVAFHQSYNLLHTADIKDGKGPIENLHIADVAKPKLGKSQALVKIKAFGLNRMDLLQRQYPVPPGASKILGVEFSGTISELSEEGGGKEGFKEGDEVFGLAYGGAYAEYIAVSTHMLVRKPKELSWEQCAGIPEVITT